jgi:hypothetical protein
MKKILFPSLILLLFSCNKETPIELNEKNIIKNNELSIRTIEYDGHEYLYYDGHNTGSICHLESCKCKIN